MAREIANMKSDVKRVLVVDDSSTMRNVICRVLSKESDFEVVGTASDGVGTGWTSFVMAKVWAERAITRFRTLGSIATT